MTPDELDELLLRESPIFREAFEKFEKEAIEKGKKKGIEWFLRNLFMLRMERDLSPAEQEALIRRIEALGPDPLMDVGLMLKGDALAGWLLDPGGC